MLTGANGRLEPEGRKQIRLAEEARIRTRQLVKPDRSNVDCAQMKCIALTYDDGPEPGLTLELLKTLQEKQAVATFFVLGSRAHHQRHVLKHIAAGHNEIGNHTWSHHDLTDMPNQQISDEIDRTNNLIREVVGFQPKMVRPPMGRYDQRVVEVAHMAIGLWSVDPRDWHNRDQQTVYSRAISAAGPGKVIILHDTHPTTIQASTWIVDELQRQGYVLVTMSELFGITNDNVQEFSGRLLLYR
jgi:peptidoglycan/xylan/chitin deacetylase (PgdA/CDA1 family)